MVQRQGTEHVPELIPARMLNELAFCPRLFALEWIDGLWRENAHTVEGGIKHKRVDSDREPRASTTGIPGIDGEFQSMTLSSEASGLIAKLDRVIVEGDIATPVEHKKGRSPSRPVQIPRDLVAEEVAESEEAACFAAEAEPDEGVRAWWPDQVQLAVQMMLLEEAGFVVRTGFVWYAEDKRKVEVPLTPELRAAVVSMVAKAREIAAAQRLPPPLENSSKCIGCSLQPFCLPDELVVLQSGDVRSEEQPLRRILASTADTVPVYVFKQGAMVRKKNDVLRVEFRGEMLEEIPLRQVSQVAIFGNAQISSQAVVSLVEAGIPIVYLTRAGRFLGMTNGLPLHNVLLRKAQFEQFAKPEPALSFARAVVAAKVLNQRTLLMRNGEGVPDEVFAAMKREAEAAERAEDMDELRGHEGAGAALYFKHFGTMVRAGEDGLPAFDFEGRNRRPARDPLNAMLSFGYALLAKELTATCLAVGLDPLLGALHAPAFRRPALALDLMEEWRPVIVDSAVLTLVNNRMVAPGDFYRIGDACEMRDTARRRMLEAYERRLFTEVIHPVFGYRVSYRRALEVQVRLLGRVLAGELETYVGFRTR